MTSNGKRQGGATRTERLEAALRANLKRRKSQVRARGASPAEAGPASGVPPISGKSHASGSEPE